MTSHAAGMKIGWNPATGEPVVKAISTEEMYADGLTNDKVDFIHGHGTASPLSLNGLQACIGDEDYPITSIPTYGGIDRGSAVVHDPNLLHIAKRKLDQLRKDGEMLPSQSRTWSREQDGKLLPIQRKDGKRVAGESGRQRRMRLKLERREATE